MLKSLNTEWHTKSRPHFYLIFRSAHPETTHLQSRLSHSQMASQSTVASTHASPVLEVPLSHEVLNQIYATMFRSRLLFQHTPKGVHINEAIFAGALQNTEADDLIVTATSLPVLEILRGADLSSSLGKNVAAPGPANNVVVAEPETFTGVAAGLALATRRAGSSSVVVVFASGKATRGRAFESASHFASNRRLPMVVIADWTDSRRSARSHDGKHLSRWPFPTIAVDGRDPIAVYRVTKEAISAARRGHGPTLVDCVNFLAPGSRGRDQRDSLLSFRGYLQRHDAWSDLWHSELEAKYQQEITAARNRKR